MRRNKMTGKELEKFAQQNIDWTKTTSLNNHWISRSSSPTHSTPVDEISIKPNVSKDLVRSNSMKTEQLIKEPIDNPLAEMKKTPEGYCTEVLVRIVADKINSNDFDVKYLIFEDNSVGISKERFAECLSMGRLDKDKEPNSLHEHSAGLKISIWSFGDLDLLVSKVAGSKCGYKILELPCEGQLKIYEDHDTFKENEQGTKIVIRVTNKQKVSLISRKSDISGRLIPALGAVYADALKVCQMTKRVFKVSFSLEDVDGNVIEKWYLKPEEMYYRNNSKDITLPFEDKKSGTEAFLEFGIAARDSEYLAKNLPERSKLHPHHPWSKKIEIVMNDRVIARVSAEELINEYCDEKDKLTGNCMVPYQGRLYLRKGFKTNLFKENVLNDENYVNLIKKIAPIISGFIEKEAHKSNVIQQTERDYTKQLATCWKSGGIHCETFRKVEGINGEIDILKYDKSKEFLNEKDLGAVTDLKIEEARALDCYQVLMYTDHCSRASKEKAILIAPSFSEGCINAASHIKKKYGLSIELKTLDSTGVHFAKKQKKTRSTKRRTEKRKKKMICFAKDVE